MGRSDPVLLVSAACLLFLVVAGPVHGAVADMVPVNSGMPVEVTSDSQANGQPVDDENGAAAAVENHRALAAYAGYRFLSTHGQAGRNFEYEYLHPGPVAGGTVLYLDSDLKVRIDGAYLNEKDYHGEALFDYKGEYRGYFRTESLFHNLEAEQLVVPAVFSGAPYRIAADPAGAYGIKVEQDIAQLRYKVHSYPFHVNLGYWRMFKEGSTQLRFADVEFRSAAPNTLFSSSRPVKRQTQEGTIGLDTHLGPVDIIYTFLIRQYSEQTPVPVDNYSNRLTGVVEGRFHNENPDSRYFAHTVRLHTSLTGGLVGAASYTYGRRDNMSDLAGAEQARAVLHNAAGDITYTPSPVFTVALRYRLQQVDRSTAFSLMSPFVSGAILPVKTPLDTSKNVFVSTLSFRPSGIVTVSGEYRGEFTQTSNTSSWRQPGNSSLPEDSEIHKGTLTVSARPLKGMKLKALYAYSAVNKPSYGNSYAEKHEGQFLASYNTANCWGATVGYKTSRESNDQITLATIVVSNPPPPITITSTLPPFMLARDRSLSTATASLWCLLLKRLTITGSYALLRDKVDQGILFTGLTPGIEDSVSYTRQGQIYSLNATYHHNESFDFSLSLQQVRSLSAFTPSGKSLIDPLLGVVVSTAGIEQISRLKTVENSLSARADYHLGRNYSCSLEYVYRDIDDRMSSLNEGTSHLITTSLATTW